MANKHQNSDSSQVYASQINQCINSQGTAETWKNKHIQRNLIISK